MLKQTTCVDVLDIVQPWYHQINRFNRSVANTVMYNPFFLFPGWHVESVYLALVNPESLSLGLPSTNRRLVAYPSGDFFPRPYVLLYFSLDWAFSRDAGSLTSDITNVCFARQWTLIWFRNPCMARVVSWTQPSCDQLDATRPYL